MSNWRKIPPILLVAFVLDLAFGIAHLVQRLTISQEHYFDHVDRWGMAATGMWALFSVMVGIGLFDLAGRLSGRAAVGVRVAAIGVVAVFCIGMAMNMLFMFDVLPHGDWVWRVDQYLYWTISTAAAVGLLVASPRSSLAVSAFAVCMFVLPPPFLGEALFKGLDLGFVGGQALYAALGLAHTAATLVLVHAASDGASAPRHELAVKGFDRAAGALFLRVVAAAIAMMFGLIAAASTTQSTEAILKFAMMAQLVVNLASFAVFGLGAIDVARSSLEGVPRYTAALAGAASLWCVGVLLDQFPHYYQILYGRESVGSSGEDRLQAMNMVMPLVGTLSCAVFAGALAVFARARGDEVLAGRAASGCTSYVVLMLAGVGTTNFLLKEATSTSSAIGMMLVAAGCFLVAQVMLAKVCRAASFSLDSAPGLPTAVAKITEPT